MISMINDLPISICIMTVKCSFSICLQQRFPIKRLLAARTVIFIEYSHPDNLIAITYETFKNSHACFYKFAGTALARKSIAYLKEKNKTNI
jgi:hypothetical protein